MELRELALEPGVASVCQALQTAHPYVRFLSGRRRRWEQAQAMARNHVEDPDHFLIGTYREGHTLLQWMREECPMGWERNVTVLTGFFLGILRADPSRIRSAHLSGHAVDLEPLESEDGTPTADGYAVIDWIRRHPQTVTFLRREGDLRRWHWELRDE